MAGFEFYRKVLWAEIFALAEIAIVTILPIKLGYVVAGKAELNVKAYFAAAILVILLANVAYIVKSPAGIRVKATLISVAVTAIACVPWIAQAKLRSLDFSHLAEGNGVPSLMIFGVVIAVCSYLAALMTALKAKPLS